MPDWWRNPIISAGTLGHGRVASMLAVRFPADTRAEIKRLAHQELVSEAEVVRQLVRLGLEALAGGEE